MAASPTYINTITTTSTGTHKNGKKVTITGLTFSRMEGRKVVEEFFAWDTLSEKQQLGYTLSPPAETAAAEPAK